MMIKSRRGHHIVEFLLLFTVVVTAFVTAFRLNGKTHTNIIKGLERSVQGVGKTLNDVNFQTDIGTTYSP